MTGRFQVITGQPQVRPGACLVCRGIEGPFIDTLQGDDFLGGFFFCYNCVKEMSTVLGITVDINQLEQHKAYYRGAQDTIAGVERHLNDYFKRLDISSALPNVPNLDSNGSVDSPNGEAMEGDESGEERSGTGSGEFNFEVNGSPFDDRSASVPSGTGDGADKEPAV